jgi:hypothetical protein
MQRSTGDCCNFQVLHCANGCVRTLSVVLCMLCCAWLPWLLLNCSTCILQLSSDALLQKPSYTDM